MFLCKKTFCIITLTIAGCSLNPTGVSNSSKVEPQTPIHLPEATAPIKPKPMSFSLLWQIDSMTFTGNELLFDKNGEVWLASDSAQFGLFRGQKKIAVGQWDDYVSNLRLEGATFASADTLLDVKTGKASPLNLNVLFSKSKQKLGARSNEGIRQAFRLAGTLGHFILTEKRQPRGRGVSGVKIPKPFGWFFLDDSGTTELFTYSPIHQPRAIGVSPLTATKLWVSVGKHLDVFLEKKHIRRIDFKAGFNANCLAFSHDGLRLAIGSFGGAVVVYNTSTWKEIRRHQHSKKAIKKVAFGPRSTLYSLGGGTLRMWQRSSQTSQEVYSSEGLRSFAVSPKDGSILVSVESIPPTKGSSSVLALQPR